MRHRVSVGSGNRSSELWTIQISKLQSIPHSVQAATTAAQRAGNWVRSNLSEATQNLNRFPIQIRRDQTRQQSSAGIARAQRARNWEQNNLLEATQNLNRFPIQIRRDQARQQMSAGTARAQHAGNWEQSNLSEATQNLNRCPIQIRRDQARQQSSAGGARRGSNRQRAPPAAAAGVSGHRPHCRP